MKPSIITIVIILSGMLFYGCSGESSVSVQYKDAFDLQIEYAAIETLSGYRMKAIEEDDDGGFQEIPPVYWHEEIKAMNPVKVYENYNNLAVVLDETAFNEEGLYILVPFSSYYPEDSDTIHFVPITDTTFEFNRSMNPMN